MALHLLNTMDEKHGRFTMKTLYVVTSRHRQILMKEIDTHFFWFFFANRCRRLIIFIELVQTIFHVSMLSLIIWFTMRITAVFTEAICKVWFPYQDRKNVLAVDSTIVRLNLNPTKLLTFRFVCVLILPVQISWLFYPIHMNAIYTILFLRFLMYSKQFAIEKWKIE